MNTASPLNYPPSIASLKGGLNELKDTGPCVERQTQVAREVDVARDISNTIMSLITKMRDRLGTVLQYKDQKPVPGKAPEPSPLVPLASNLREINQANYQSIAELDSMIEAIEL